MIPKFFHCCVQRFSYSQFHFAKGPLYLALCFQNEEGSLLKDSIPFHSPISMLLPKIHIILLIWCKFLQTRIQTLLKAVLLEQQFLKVRNDCDSVGALTYGDQSQKCYWSPFQLQPAGIIPPSLDRAGTGSG